jgi:multiple sugar transport system permease protein
MRNRSTLKTVILYILLIVITFLFAFPLLWGMLASFRSDIELATYAYPVSIYTFIPVDFTLNSYVVVFRDYNFLRPILNTFFVTIATVIAGSVVNSIAAFSFALFEFRFKRLIFAAALVSFMIPFEAIALPLYSIVDSIGWINTYTGYIVPSVASGLVLFLFTQFFRDIPTSLIEAARIDGASWFTVFGRIMVPLSVSVFVTGGLMTYTAQWNAYLWPLLVGRSKEIRLVQTALGYFQQEELTLVSPLYAAAMVSALVPLIVFFPFQRFYVQGIVSSGLKG